MLARDKSLPENVDSDGDIAYVQKMKLEFQVYI